MENSFTLYKGCWLSKCPPHSSCYLKIDKCGKLLNRGGYLLRNVYDWDCEHETSFWFVIKDSFGRNGRAVFKNEKSSEEIVEDIRCVSCIGK